MSKVRYTFRFDRVVRRRTNFKKTNLLDDMPRILVYWLWLATKAYPCLDGSGEPIIPGHAEWDSIGDEKRKWGNTPPEYRFHTDQIPIAPLGGWNTTWAKKGADKVWIASRGGESDAKRCCSHNAV